MPRRREKTRVEHLADALESAEHLAACLSSVDLRTTTGELKALVQESRTLTDELGEKLAEALRTDIPMPARPLAS